MTPENTKLLFDRHSHMFRGKDLPLTENLMPFGFECGDGWFTLLDELCTTVDRILADNDELAKEFIVVQVKEKFGTLRFYTSPTPDAIHWVIDFAEGMSSKICERCGNPGKTGDRGWLTTLCESCKE
jgi:hypothetical protein